MALAQVVNGLPSTSPRKNIWVRVNTQARIRVNRTSAGFLEGWFRFRKTESKTNRQIMPPQLLGHRVASECARTVFCAGRAVTKPGDLWILGEHRLLCG